MRSAEIMPRDSLTEYLTDALLNGTIPPGARLPPERLLAERFGLSRPMVREVLKSMAERGLIVTQPGRGNFARELKSVDGMRPLDAYYRTTATAREVTDARILLETQLCALAATQATDPELARMKNALARLDEADNVIDKARWDITFHALIAKAARNTVLEAMFFSISRLTFEYMLRSLGDPTVNQKGAPYHEDILRALEAHDVDAASAAMKGHLSVARTYYGADIDRPVAGLARQELTKTLGSTYSLDAVLDRVLATIDDEINDRPLV